MDHDELEALLRREGMRADELEALVAWARQRARALTADLHAPAPTVGLRSVAIDVAWSSPAASRSEVDARPLRSSRDAHAQSGTLPAGRRRGAAAASAVRTKVEQGREEGRRARPRSRPQVAATPEPELPKTEVIPLSEDAFLDEAFAALTGEPSITASPSGEIEVLESEALELVEDDEASPSDGIPAWRAALLSAELALR